MNGNKVVSAIMAMSLATAGFSFAQGYGERDDRGRNEQMQRDNQQDHRDWRQPDRRDFQGRGHYNDGRRDERGAGPNHEFHRGERLPPEYRSRQYAVDDWRGHRLSAPPRGYHWVQIGGDYVLVANSNGIILQLFLNN
ncbi:RcnB family protein [Paraherbaspirillum soli]|uniref:RcnB family protein n=1 Tax=Paraherbaspirillum soli TaxID=631222 RepID=A0ABW0M6M5_9BURK